MCAPWSACAGGSDGASHSTPPRLPPPKPQFPRPGPRSAALARSRGPGRDWPHDDRGGTTGCGGLPPPPGRRGVGRVLGGHGGGGAAGPGLRRLRRPAVPAPGHVPRVPVDGAVVAARLGPGDDLVLRGRAPPGAPGLQPLRPLPGDHGHPGREAQPAHGGQPGHAGRAATSTRSTPAPSRSASRCGWSSRPGPGPTAPPSTCPNGCATPRAAFPAIRDFRHFARSHDLCDSLNEDVHGG